MSKIKQLLEEATYIAGEPKKSDNMIKVVKLNDINFFFKKNFNKDTKKLSWRFCKFE